MTPMTPTTYTKVATELEMKKRMGNKDPWISLTRCGTSALLNAGQGLGSNHTPCLPLVDPVGEVRGGGKGEGGGARRQAPGTVKKETDN